MIPFPFTFHRSPFTMRYPCLPDRQAFTVIHEGKWLIVNGKCMENGKLLMVNSTEGAYVDG